MASEYEDFGATSRQISFSVHYKKADLMVESEEMMLTNFFIAHPCKSLIGGYLILLIVGAISLHFDCFLIPVASGREYLIVNDPIMREYELINEVLKYSLSDLDGKGSTVKKTATEDTGSM